MASLAKLFGMAQAANPEMAAAQMAEKHAGSLVGVGFIVFAIIFIIIGMIVYSAKTKKTPGVLLLVFGGLMLLGGGFLVYKTEKK
jgi:hypothetical protein